jgi:hypothetical protein
MDDQRPPDPLRVKNQMHVNCGTSVGHALTTMLIPMIQMMTMMKMMVLRQIGATISC